MTDQSETGLKQRAEALRVVAVREVDVDEECQTWFGETEADAHKCENPASHHVELGNEYDDEISMYVCPGCHAAYESRGDLGETNE